MAATTIMIEFLPGIARSSSLRQPGIEDRTIAQLKNSGGMRLIRQRQLTDGLLHYYTDTDVTASLENASLQETFNLRETITPLLQLRSGDEVIPPGTDDVTTLNETLHLR